MTPRDISWMPPIKQTVITLLVQPGTVFPEKCPTKAKTIRQNDSSDIKVPIPVMILMGLILKLVIPSNANASIFESG